VTGAVTVSVTGYEQVYGWLAVLSRGTRNFVRALPRHASALCLWSFAAPSARYLRAANTVGKSAASDVSTDAERAPFDNRQALLYAGAQGVV